MSALRIAIAVDALALETDAPADVSGVIEAVHAVEAALAELGHDSYRVAVGADARAALAALLGSPPDLVFNLCESVQGDGQGEAKLIAALELARIPVTGADSELVALARRKDRVGAVLAAHDVAIPESAVVDPPSPPRQWRTYPCIVKPAGTDGSIGITQQSIATDERELAAALERVREHSPVLVQELLTGREVNAAFVGDELLPLSEIEYTEVPAGMWPIVDYSAKWDSGSASDTMTVPRTPAALAAAEALAATRTALAAWRAVNGRGCGRIDLRADAQGRWHVLEINPNPDLAPSAGLARMAAAHGWSYRDLVERLVQDAVGRAAVQHVTHTAPAAARPSLRIAPLPRAARDTVRLILEETNMFRADEIDVALEVIDAYYTSPDQDYTALGAFTQDGELVGYSCHGPTPCTLGTYDLYWIAVSPRAQRAGVGSALLQEVERRLALGDARLLLIETSSQPLYLPTRGFYLRHGYHEVARVPEFYAPGDDRVIFAKRIHPVRRG